MCILVIFYTCFCSVSSLFAENVQLCLAHFTGGVTTVPTVYCEASVASFDGQIFDRNTRVLEIYEACPFNVPSFFLKVFLTS